MNRTKFLIGTIAGAFTIVVIGTAMFLLPPLAEFYSGALSAGSATEVQRQAPVPWAVLLGATAYAALVTLAVMSRRERTTVTGGLTAGAVVGFLLWFAANLLLYAVSNVGTATAMLIGPLIELVPGAVAGGVIALLLRRLEDAAAAPRERAAA